MKKLLFYSLSLLVLAVSCKKNPLPVEEESEEPVFYVKADVNGLPVILEAGKQNYYMNSSHQQENNGVYVYKAELKQNSCSSVCGYGISILFNDVVASVLNGTMNPSAALFLGEHPFNDGNLPPLGFNSSFNSYMPTVSDFTWTVNGNNLNKNQKDIVTYLDNGKTYTVGLKVNNQGCVSEHFNVFKVGKPVQGNIYGVKSELTYSFTAVPSPTFNAGQYLWDFGDGTSSNAMTTSHTYAVPQDYDVKLTMVRFGTPNDTCVTHYNARAFTLNYCHANYLSSFSPVANTMGLSAITINLTDPTTGAVYSSSAFDQPTGNKFEIVSVEDYKQNDLGNPTKKVKIRFSCTVKSSSGLININNGEAVVAVSFK